MILSKSTPQERADVITKFVNVGKVQQWERKCSCKSQKISAFEEVVQFQYANGHSRWYITQLHITPLQDTSLPIIRNKKGLLVGLKFFFFVGFCSQLVGFSVSKKSQAFKIVKILAEIRLFYAIFEEFRISQKQRLK